MASRGPLPPIEPLTTAEAEVPLHQHVPGDDIYEAFRFGRLVDGDLVAPCIDVTAGPDPVGTKIEASAKLDSDSMTREPRHRVQLEFILPGTAFPPSEDERTAYLEMVRDAAQLALNGLNLITT